MEPVGDQLHGGPGVQSGGHHPGFPVVEGGHGVEQMGGVGGPGLIGGHGRVIVRRGVAQGHGAVPAGLPDEGEGPRLLRGQGDEPHQAPRSLVQPMEHMDIRGMQVVRVLGAALLSAHEGPLQVDARHLGPVGRPLKSLHRLHGLCELPLLQRHGGGAPGGDPLGGVVAGHRGQPLRLAVAGVLAHGPVGVDVDEPGDQIPALGVRAPLHLGTDGPDGLVKVHAAGHEPAVQKYLCVGKLHILILSGRGGWPPPRTGPRAGTARRAGRGGWPWPPSGTRLPAPASPPPAPDRRPCRS